MMLLFYQFNWTQTSLSTSRAQFNTFQLEPGLFSQSTVAGYSINIMTVRMWWHKHVSAQHVVKPCIQPQNAVRAGHMEDARRMAKKKVKDSNNTTQAILKQCEGSLRWDVKDLWL